MTIQIEETVVNEIPIYFHPTSIDDPELLIQSNQISRSNNLEEDEYDEYYVDSYDFNMTLQIFILIIGFVFFPMWFISICFINSNHKNVSKLAFLNLILGSIVVIILFIILLVIETYGDYGSY